MKTRNSKINEWYAQWIINDCDTPIDEIEWLLSHLDDNTYNDLVIMYEDYGDDKD